MAKSRVKHVDLLSSNRRRQWSIEKLNFDTDRKLKRMYYIDLTGHGVQRHHEKHARRSGNPSGVGHAMQKCQWARETCSIKSDSRTTKYACIIAAHESTKKSRQVRETHHLVSGWNRWDTIEEALGRAPWLKCVCIWLGQEAKLRDADAEWRVSCAFRTGKYGKFMWMSESVRS